MSVPSWAKPGVKCVCVNDQHPFGMATGLTKGVTYTIEDVDNHLGIDLFGVPGVRATVRLNGVRKPAEFGPHDYYDLRRFRPLITKSQEQDIALFRHHLDGLPVGADA